jgi:hypothetical protein
MTILVYLYGLLSPQYGASSFCGWMRWPPDMESSCEYIEKAVADSRQGVFLQLWCWARGKKPLTIKDQLVTKCYTGPQFLLYWPKNWYCTRSELVLPIVLMLYKYFSVILLISFLLMVSFCSHNLIVAKLIALQTVFHRIKCFPCISLNAPDEMWLPI